MQLCSLAPVMLPPHKFARLSCRYFSSPESKRHGRGECTRSVSIFRFYQYHSNYGRDTRKYACISSCKWYCTGRFIMFSVITNIYNKKIKGSTLMELFAATRKMIFFFFFTTGDVRCVHHGWHGTHRYDIQVLATHTRQHGCIDILHCCNGPCV